MILKNLYFKVFAVLTLLTLAPLSSFAASPLVDVSWVKSNIGAKNVVFMDLRNIHAYQKGHVPGAIHSSYRGDKWRMKKGAVKGMLPSVEHLEKLLSKLGVDANSHVVVMHGGVSAVETGIATRIYWTLKVLGHSEVSILNGGMAAYLADKTNPLERGIVKRPQTHFKANLNRQYLATAADVSSALENKSTILDARPTDQHLGINKSGAITRTGALPGSISLPGKWVTVNNKGTFRSAKALSKLYKVQNVQSGGKRIVYCNTGHWASLGWFVDSELLGNKQSKVYDGSMAEWSRLPKASHPMEVKVNPN